MVGAAREYGTNAVFEVPELNAHSLKLSLSTMSSTLTSVKTEMTALGGNSQRTVRDVFRESLLALGRDLCVDESWWTYRSSRGEIAERLTWSLSEKKWIQQPNALLSPTAIGVAAQSRIFGEGAERMVRQFREFDAAGCFVGPALVAKESRFVEDVNTQDLRQFHRLFCETQLKAEELAVEFNKRLADIPGLLTSTPRISFLPCNVYMVNDNKLGMSGWLVERMIDAHAYRKFNSNNGYVEGSGTGTDTSPSVRFAPAAPAAYTPPAPVALGVIAEESEEEDDEDDEDDDFNAVARRHPAVAKIEVSAADIPQAFSHFSYQFSKRKMLVCDLQGVLDTSCSPPRYELTDPVIHYSSSRGRTNVFGRTDRGKKGMHSFFKTHKCSELCHLLNREWIDRGAAGRQKREQNDTALEKRFTDAVLIR